MAKWNEQKTKIVKPIFGGSDCGAIATIKNVKYSNFCIVLTNKKDKKNRFKSMTRRMLKNRMVPKKALRKVQIFTARQKKSPKMTREKRISVKMIVVTDAKTCRNSLAMKVWYLREEFIENCYNNKNLSGGLGFSLFSFLSPFCSGNVFLLLLFVEFFFSCLFWEFVFIRCTRSVYARLKWKTKNPIVEIPCK